MATAINIAGPTKLLVKQQAEATTTTLHATNDLLGFTDNDDLISISYENIQDPYYSTESGREPAAMIYQGTIATITATLIKWDEAIADNIRTSMHSDATGTMGSIGQDQFNTTFTNVENLQVKVLANSATGFTTTSYQFLKCYVESMQETSWGNAPKKLVLTIKAVRNSAGDLFLES